MFCHADAEAAKAAAELEAKAREEERKEEVLQCAREIRAARDAAARPLPTAPEPKRAKTHRDFLLEEMAWLAKEFQKYAQLLLHFCDCHTWFISVCHLSGQSGASLLCVWVGNGPGS